VKQGLKPAQQAETARSAERAQILAVDYGRARMGLAIADAETRLARPLGTLERINRNEDMRQLRELARDHGVKQIIVGLPLRLDGTRGEMAEEATRFAARVAKQIGVRVEMVDERLTSWEAERLMEEEFGRISHGKSESAGTHSPASAGKHKPRVGQPTNRKETARGVSVDAVAAAVILKEYLERQGSTEERGKV
jgi:putative pre-16S rRNA nuclease